MDIDGVDQLARLSKALREAGDKELKKEFFQGISRAVKPLKTAVKQSALDKLPSRGGLAGKVAKSRLTTRRNRNGLRLQATNAYVLRRLDSGTVRHPVFGNRNVWVNQPITPGWWTEPTEAAGPEVRREVLKAMDEVARKIERAV